VEPPGPIPWPGADGPEREPGGDTLYVGPERVEIRRNHRDFNGSAFFASLERYLRDARPPMVTWAGCIGLLSVIMICWPARRGGGRRGPVTVHQNFGTIVRPEVAPAPAPATAPEAAGGLPTQAN
jgi:hypothetical protein